MRFIKQKTVILFRNLMYELGAPVPESDIIHNMEEAKAFVARIGYPVIVRPAFTLGGTGGGICHNDQELRRNRNIGFKIFTSNTMSYLKNQLLAIKKLNMK